MVRDEIHANSSVIKDKWGVIIISVSNYCKAAKVNGAAQWYDGFCATIGKEFHRTKITS